MNLYALCVTNENISQNSPVTNVTVTNYLFEWTDTFEFWYMYMVVTSTMFLLFTVV